MSALLTTDLPFPVRRGKVRDVYDLGDRLLLVATDRISAFDWVMPNGIPEKGRIRLQPANRDMEPIYVDPTRAFQILGVAVGVYRRIRG